jgi:aspartate racemase
MSQHIGIVACSAEGAALCYRTICVEGAELVGRHGHPEVSMHTYSLAQYMTPIYRGDWAEVGKLMLSSAEKLAAIGADFVICPDNTIHQALPFIESQLPVPWLHIADVVGDEAVRRGYRRLGLTGTRYLVESDVYPQRLTMRGLEYARPAADDRQECDRIIFDELVNGVFADGSRQRYVRIIEQLAARGCDAVALVCTEIPLLVRPEDSPLPTLDSTLLLARAAFDVAVSHRALPTWRGGPLGPDGIPLDDAAPVG